MAIKWITVTQYFRIHVTLVFSPLDYMFLQQPKRQVRIKRLFFLQGNKHIYEHRNGTSLHMLLTKGLLPLVSILKMSAALQLLSNISVFSSFLILFMVTSTHKRRSEVCFCLLVVKILNWGIFSRSACILTSTDLKPKN